MGRAKKSKTYSCDALTVHSWTRLSAEEKAARAERRDARLQYSQLLTPGAARVQATRESAVAELEQWFQVQIDGCVSDYVMSMSGPRGAWFRAVSKVILMNRKMPGSKVRSKLHYELDAPTPVLALPGGFCVTPGGLVGPFPTKRKATPKIRGQNNKKSKKK